MKSATSGFIAAILVAGTLALTGCASYGYGPHRAPPASVIYVNRPPPPPPAIIIQPRPSAASVWISGYWTWYEGDYHWVAGRWTNDAPHAGARWIPDRWVKTNKGYYRQPGRWK